MRTLRDWTAGDSVRNNDHHQQAVDALRELRDAIPLPGGDPGAYPEAWTGKIVEHGKDASGGDLPDYTDSRYWVEKQFVLPPYGDDADAAAALDTDASNAAGIPGGETKPPNVFTVTNLPECATGGADAAGGPTGCHLLSVGDVVRVWAEYDGGDPNRKRYLMRVDPSPVRVRVTTAIAAGRYNGKAQKDPTADVPTTGALAAGDMGTDGASVVLLYPPEVGGSSAALPLGKVYLGDLTRVNADGTAVLTLAGGGTGGLVRVTLASTSGATGTDSGPPTWVYTVTYGGGAVATGKSPEVGRSNGDFTAATIGIGYVDDSGTWQLLQAFEPEATVPCATDDGGG